MMSSPGHSNTHTELYKAASLAQLEQLDGADEHVAHSSEQSMHSCSTVTVT